MSALHATQRCIASRSPRICKRAFSVTTPRSIYRQQYRTEKLIKKAALQRFAARKEENQLANKTYAFKELDELSPPPYPYGPARVYKQADGGLYGRAQIRYGNNVSVKTKTKTRRTWTPNIQRKRIYSKALLQFIQVKVSTRVLRTIEKVGGLDEYLIGSDKPARIKELGVMGWRLRWVIMQTPTIRRRLGAEARALGVDEETIFVRGWMTKKQIAAYLPRRDAITTEEAQEIAEQDNGLASDGRDYIADAQADGSLAETSPTALSVDKADEAEAAVEQQEDPVAAAAEDAVAQQEYQHNGTQVDWVEVERLFQEQAQRAIPIVKKLHNFKGRRGRQTQKYKIGVYAPRTEAPKYQEEVYPEGQPLEGEALQDYQGKQRLVAEPMPSSTPSWVDSTDEAEFIQPSRQKPWWKFWGK